MSHTTLSFASITKNTNHDAIDNINKIINNLTAKPLTMILLSNDNPSVKNRMLQLIRSIPYLSLVQSSHNDMYVKFSGEFLYNTNTYQMPSEIFYYHNDVNADHDFPEIDDLVNRIKNRAKHADNITRYDKIIKQHIQSIDYNLKTVIVKIDTLASDAFDNDYQFFEFLMSEPTFNVSYSNNKLVIEIA